MCSIFYVQVRGRSKAGPMPSKESAYCVAIRGKYALYSVVGFRYLVVAVIVVESDGVHPVCGMLASPHPLCHCLLLY